MEIVDTLCGFCAEIYELDTDNNLLKRVITPALGLSDRILLENDNFIAIPTLGSFVPGYIMVVSKAHYNCIGKIPMDNIPDLESISFLVKKAIKEKYGTNIVVFEHGSVSCSNKFGGCIDHAHLHIVPCPDSLIEKIVRYGFNIYNINGLHDLRKFGKDEIAYLYFQDTDGKEYAITGECVISQFFRQLISAHLGVGDKWDWRQHFFLDNLQKTIEDMRGSFLGEKD